MRRYSVNGEVVAAVSANDAIRVYCANQGYRPIREPDIHEASLQEKEAKWVDEDGEAYEVSLAAEDAEAGDLNQV